MKLIKFPEIHLNWAKWDLHKTPLNGKRFIPTQNQKQKGSDLLYSQMWDEIPLQIFHRKIGSETTHHQLFCLATLLILRHTLNILGISVLSVLFIYLFFFHWQSNDLYCQDVDLTLRHTTNCNSQFWWWKVPDRF